MFLIGLIVGIIAGAVGCTMVMKKFTGKQVSAKVVIEDLAGV